MALGAKAEHGERFVPQHIQVGVVVGINFCRHIFRALDYLRGRATLPVRVSSSTPKVFISSRNFSTLLSLPVTSMERLFGCTSTILARKMSVICITSARDLESTLTFTRINS